jgi:thiosulfate/3-mercaptopyruvate sulfurtransferase
MKTYPYPSGDGKVKWISTEWLSGHIDDIDLTILDVQPNIHDYIMGHIPNAIYLNEGFLRSAWKGLPAMYVPGESIKPILDRTGLEPNKPTVIYSGAGRYSKCTAGLGDGLEQPMMAYSLARFGHKKIYILDGGIEKWKDEGRELTKVYPECKESNFNVDVQKDYFVTYDEFSAMKDREDVIVFDARPADVYEQGGLWPKLGHIPGAFSLPWRSLMTKDNARLLKSDEELKEILGKFDMTQDKTLLIYCGTGREATNEFCLLKWYLGHDKIKIFEGSFTEWSSHPENPTVTGSKPV